MKKLTDYFLLGLMFAAFFIIGCGYYGPKALKSMIVAE